jgi:hypothetical protein
VSGYALSVFPQHQALLEASAISPEVARARGYVSVDTKKRLEDLGITAGRRSVPGLLIPLRRAEGSVWGYQYRPDKPVAPKGAKLRKYETPTGQRNGIDIPLAAKDAMADPSVTLWITEGSRKADSAVTAGLCCVSLSGVWNWVGKNARGAVTVIPDWRDIALAGRRIILAFDSDSVVKPGVLHALRELGRYLEGKDAKVEYLHLPHDGDAKTGLDDYIAADGAGGLMALVRPGPPTAANTSATSATAAATAGQRVADSKPVADAPAAEWDGDPAALLDDVAEFLRGYVAFPSHAASAVTLWAAHTHLVASFDSTPRLALLSPEKQCGKTRVLELLELLCAGAETLSDASPAYLYRRIGSQDAGPVTILLDEADAIWKRGKGDETAEALRSVINAGHRKSATVGRVETGGPEPKLTRFPVFAPAAIAGIGGLPDTITDRAVVIRMRRRAPDQPVRPYRERITRPEGEALRGQLAAWSAQAAAKVGEPWPDMPDGITDRPADVWEPLLMVADLAGGDWPKLAREACTALVTGSKDDTETTGTRLLTDIRDVWPRGAGTSGTSGTALIGQVPDVPLVPHMGTDELLRLLHGVDEAPWADWYGHPLNPRDLARLLKPYGVKSVKVRIGEQSVRGYRVADLIEPWRSYLAAGAVPEAPGSPSDDAPREGEPEPGDDDEMEWSG